MRGRGAKVSGYSALPRTFLGQAREYSRWQAIAKPASPAHSGSASPIPRLDDVRVVRRKAPRVECGKPPPDASTSERLGTRGGSTLPAVPIIIRLRFPRASLFWPVSPRPQAVPFQAEDQPVVCEARPRARHGQSSNPLHGHLRKGGPDNCSRLIPLGAHTGAITDSTHPRLRPRRGLRTRFIGTPTSPIRAGEAADY